MGERNLDAATVAGFGREWTHYDQSGVPDAELAELFERYFAGFPWSELPEAAEGFDLGCGSGRWARFVASRVATLHLIDASAEAIEVARQNLGGAPGARFHCASVDALPLAEASQDFGYSLGVLHHVPDTRAGVESCVRLLRPGAPFLLYLYYAFDNRPAWYRALWRATEVGRAVISRLPFGARRRVTAAIAAAVYWPLARLAAALERRGKGVDALPLSAYRHASFYTMRTDALDRFGTPLEKRFTRSEIENVMRDAGLERIRFSERPPYWCAVGFRSASPIAPSPPSG